MSDKTDTRYDNNYRYRPDRMKHMRKWLYISWAISAGASIIVEIIFALIVSATTNDWSGNMPDWAGSITAAIIVAGFVGWPLLYGAWFGGRAIHRYGPVGTLMVVVGIFLLVGLHGFGYVGWIVGLTVMGIGVLLTFYVGFIAKVPMWLQLPIVKSPRLNIQQADEKTKKK